MVHGYLIDRRADFMITRAGELGDEDEEDAAAYDAMRKSDVKPAEWQSAFQVFHPLMNPALLHHALQAAAQKNACYWWCGAEAIT